MDENSNEVEQTANCLNELLGGTTEEAKIGEFRKAAETKLEGLANGADQAEENYRKGLAECKATWERQDEKICKMKKQLEHCYEWKCYIDKIICKEVIQKVWELKDNLRSKLGDPQKCLDDANELVGKAQDQLDAWQTISAWIKNRLQLNEALIEEICKLDNCDDRLFAIYIFYFELWPAHKSLEKAPEELPDEVRNPERAYCKDICDAEPPKDPEIMLCGFPWFIDPNLYNCKLADVWKIWRDAGVETAKKQCAVDAIAKCREDYESASTPEAKRDASRDALRRYGDKRCQPKDENCDEPTTYQQS